ncbi:hypothetical protein Lupro_11405 [Lutibacter profundi]|uniref:DUF983 domain-containing protein n=1 Tax=Lutibacter profundi TaxID=1622118 RepID=A0A0X8G8A2_9FLAO|nr:DUF983 domain-containing protein [Lutibacter profundi]AMC11834.1 hypothetical protein Lupro_11405 [Lutibacter profundi]
MIKKGTKLYSIFFNKCPKCHEGDFMKEKNILKLHKAFQMHEKCSNCGLKYTIEPSFFYGAMYVNYALTVGLSIVTFTIATLFSNLNLIQIFIPIVIVLVLTVPITIRLSRIIWINLFIKYQKDTHKITQNEQ